MPSKSSAPLERTVQTNIRKALVARGAYVVKYPGGKFGQGGTPDLLVCYRGYFVGLEVKRLGWTPSDVTPLQNINLQEIKTAGGLSYVVSSKEEAFEALRLIDGLIAAQEEAHRTAWGGA